MKARKEQENQGGNSRSRGRKVIKSPLNIRDKIKELDQKLEKEAIYKNILKKKNSKEIEKKINVTRFDNKPIDNNIKKPESIEKSSNSNEKLQKRVFLRRNLSNPKDKQTVLTSPNLPIHHKVSNEESKGSDEDNEGLNLLKAQNQKYKKIYNSSVQRMGKLQGRLKQIKMEHENQTGMLEEAINNLTRQINSKKIMLGHLYDYENNKKKNLLTANDAIITETDNEYSNSNISGVKQKPTIRVASSSDLSKLSLQSKER